jgi:hypothetical protein
MAGRCDFGGNLYYLKRARNITAKYHNRVSFGSIININASFSEFGGGASNKIINVVHFPWLIVSLIVPIGRWS